MRNLGQVELWDVWISSAGLRFLGEEMAAKLIQMCKISWGKVTFRPVQKQSLIAEMWDVLQASWVVYNFLAPGIHEVSNGHLKIMCVYIYIYICITLHSTSRKN